MSLQLIICDFPAFFCWKYKLLLGKNKEIQITGEEPCPRVDWVPQILLTWMKPKSVTSRKSNHNTNNHKIL